MSSAQFLEAATTISDGFKRHRKHRVALWPCVGRSAFGGDGMCGVTMASDVASHLRVHCPIFGPGPVPMSTVTPRDARLSGGWPPLTPQTFRLKYFALFIQHIQNIQHWVIVPQ